MTDKLQLHYNKLIRYANLSFVQSEEPMFAALHRELLSKAEAFEASADLFWSDFNQYVTPTTTMRFNSIREHHIEEGLEHDEPMSDYSNKEN